VDFEHDNAPGTAAARAPDRPGAALMARRRHPGLLTLPQDGGLRGIQAAMLMSLFALAGIALATLTP